MQTSGWFGSFEVIFKRVIFNMGVYSKHILVILHLGTIGYVMIFNQASRCRRLSHKTELYRKLKLTMLCVLHVSHINSSIHQLTGTLQYFLPLAIIKCEFN